LATRKAKLQTDVELENIRTAISFQTDDARKADVRNLYNKGKLLICLQFHIKQNHLRRGVQLSLKTNFKLSKKHLWRADQLNRLKIDLLYNIYLHRHKASAYTGFTVFEFNKFKLFSESSELLKSPSI